MTSSIQGATMMGATTPRRGSIGKEDWRVLFATIVGTAVEWYDFFIYATAAGLVFGELFFEPAGTGVGQILSFATAGISSLFRPLGAFLARHLSCRHGPPA